MGLTGGDILGFAIGRIGKEALSEKVIVEFIPPLKKEKQPQTSGLKIKMEGVIDE